MSDEIAMTIYFWVWGILATLVFIIGVTATTRAWLEDRDGDIFAMAPLVMMVAMILAGLWPATILVVPIALIAGPQIWWHKRSRLREAKREKRKNQLREEYLAAASMFDKNSDEYRILVNLAYEV